MKIIKRVGKILIALILLIVILFIGLYINGTCRYRNEAYDLKYSSWLKEIPDDALVREIVFPGSHDAGTIGMLFPFRTQNYSIKDQLKFGARYFDIRVNKTDKGYQIYHSFSNGADFLEILADIKEFIINNPSEVIILDFQHFSGESMADVYEILEEELASEGLVIANNKGITDVSFIHDLTLGEARGGCIIFFGETDEDNSNWLFLRNNDECSRDDTSLDSYYVTEYHTGGFDTLVSKGHELYFKRLEDTIKDNSNGIFVLQCQLTDGKMIFGPFSEERRQEKEMSEYISSLKTNEHFKDINVIMRDFLTPNKCKEIIGLNKEKGLF